MARARNIKPAFFDNEELSEIDFAGRLLFIGLWTLSDRNGVLEDRPKRIKARLFPYDDVDVNGYLTVLERLNFVARYSIENKHYIIINNFSKHQRPHHTEKESGLPLPLLEMAVSGDNGESTLNNGYITENIRSVTLLTTDSLTTDSPFIDSPHNGESTPNEKPKEQKGRKPKNNPIGTRWKEKPIEEEYTSYAKSLNFSDNDIKTQYEEFSDYWLASSSSKARKVVWLAAWRAWCKNAIKFNKVKISKAVDITKLTQEELDARYAN